VSNQADKLRNLQADLAICEAATPGPWMFCEYEHTRHDGTYWHILAGRGFFDDYSFQGFELASYMSSSDARFIAEAREGWPHAIRRALAAEARAAELEAELERSEAQIDRLRNEINILQEQLERRCART